MTGLKQLVALVLLAGVAWACAAQTADSPGQEAPAESEVQREARLQWWRAARFGLFIHWGPVSLKGTEIGWSRGGERRGTGGTGEIPVEEYDQLYKRFCPTRFNAGEWVTLAKQAGMKYVVFTTKHHDGFCMFDTALSDYKITNSPFQRDIVKELADACHREGLRLGFYYSPPDWHHPEYRTQNHRRYVDYLHRQVRELCTRYGQVDILWFDGLGGTAADWDAPPLLRVLRELQPDILINNRAGLPADFDTPEQRIGGFQNARPWESCITLCEQWAWKPEDRLKPLKECLQTLIRCAGGDGNLLLNIGPMPTGEIEPRQVARLREMGDWLKRFGESIYGTRGGPFMPSPWGVSTHRDRVVYLHLLSWPGEDVILPPIPRRVVRSTLLTGGQASAEQTADGIRVQVPPGDRQEIDTIVALELDGPAGELAAIPWRLPSHSLAFGRSVKACNVFRQMPEYGPEKAVDDDAQTRWATDAGTKTAWLEVDLGEPARFDQVKLQEAVEYGRRVEQFELQHLLDGEWRTCFRGTTIGRDFTAAFAPVSARRVRLVILSASEGPTITEFQLFLTGQRGSPE